MKLHRRLKHILMLVVVLALVEGLIYLCTSVCDEAPALPNPTTPDAALTVLCSGNLRFVNSRRTYSTDGRHDAEYRHRTAKGQHPFATIVCCSDSRVCPEFIFDLRPGTIFTIRNAGNVVDEDVMASLEYAVEHLHVPLIVILGHKGCGAIEAVCDAGEKPLNNHLKALQTHMLGIRKQVIECKHRHDDDLVNRLAEENAKQQAIGVLRDSPTLQTAVGRSEVRLVYGLYDMEVGSVEFFNLDGDPP